MKHPIVLQCTTMKHNYEVGIRALKQNASAVVAKAAAGEVHHDNQPWKAGGEIDSDSRFAPAGIE